MPSGKLGGANLSAATNTTLYTVPVSRVASFSVNFTNRNTNSTLVRLAIGTSGTPSNDDWLLFDTVVQGNSSLERTGLALDASKVVVVYSSLANVTATAYGYEE
jgi:hypothetical protein